MILTIGPLAEIFPLVILFTYPDIITAPGAAKIIPVNDIATAKSSIVKLALNSAKHPNL